MNRQQHIETIFQNFHAIKRAFSHSSRFSNEHFGVTMTQASALMLLMHEGGKTMGEIAAALGVSKSAASQLLDGLIEQGFVDREQSEDDKRVVRVSLSDAGYRHFKQVREQGGQKIAELFDLLNDEELVQIESITSKLARKTRGNKKC